MKYSTTYTLDDVLTILNQLAIEMRMESKKCDDTIDENNLKGVKANIQLAKQLGLDKAISIVIAKSISVANKSINLFNFNDYDKKIGETRSGASTPNVQNNQYIPSNGYGRSLPTYDGPVEFCNGRLRPKEPDYTNLINNYLSKIKPITLEETEDVDTTYQSLLDLTERIRAALYEEISNIDVPEK